MTFAQLRSFATVARLGSVRAAARELHVSEPAVSAAIASLRRDFEDELLIRSGNVLRLTAGGERLAAAASEILGLADEARRSVSGESRLIRLVATSEVAEYVVAPLVDAFTRRFHDIEVSVSVKPPESFAGLLADRVADVALGPRPDGADALPFLRYRLVVVAGPGHPLAGRRHVSPAALAGERWLVGPSGADPSTPVGSFLARHRLAPDDVRAFP